MAIDTTESVLKSSEQEAQTINCWCNLRLDMLHMEAHNHVLISAIENQKTEAAAAWQLSFLYFVIISIKSMYFMVYLTPNSTHFWAPKALSPLISGSQGASRVLPRGLPGGYQGCLHVVEKVCQLG